MSGTPAHRLGARDHVGNLVLGRAGREIEPLDPEAAEDAADQRLGRRVERARMDDDVAGLDEGQQQGRDRRHARGEAERILGIFPDAEPVLEDLLVGAVEARIDEALGAAPGACR